MMRTCKHCGVPEFISRYHQWTPDGRLTTRDGKQRLVIIEKDLIEKVIVEMERELPVDVKHIFREAKAIDAREYVRSVVGWKIYLLRTLPFLRKNGYQGLAEVCRALGLADAEIIEYQPAKKLVVKFSHCYNVDLFGGDVNGAFMFLDKKCGDVQVAKEGESYYMILDCREKKENLFQKVLLPQEKPRRGYISYKRCEACKTPIAVSFFRWDEEKGSVYDTRTGGEVIFIDVAGINMAFEKTEKEYGHLVGGKLERIASNITKNVVDTLLPQIQWKHRKPEERVRDLFFLAFRGMGNPIFTVPTGGGLRVRVENPFNYAFVAGITASFIARNQPVVFDWRKSGEGVLEVDINFERAFAPI